MKLKRAPSSLRRAAGEAVARATALALLLCLGGLPRVASYDYEQTPTPVNIFIAAPSQNSTGQLKCASVAGVTWELLQMWGGESFTIPANSPQGK